MNALKSFLLFFFTIGYLFPQENLAPFLPKVLEKYSNIRDIAIAPEGDEIYFSIEDNDNIAYITKTKDGWSIPKPTAFSGAFRDIEPAFSPDGKKLFFASNRPLNDTLKVAKDYDIWFVEKVNGTWSEPKNLGTPINSNQHEFYPSIAKNGHLYFTANRANTTGGEDIYRSKLLNGNYQEPKPLKGELNTINDEFNAYVAPSEKFIIFSSIRPNEGLGGGDLYISYNDNNQWSEAQLLPKVNSPYLDFCPFIDFSTHRFYFTSQRTGIKDYGTFKKGRNKLYYIPLNELMIN